jgi:hypothetical protein
VVVLFVTEDALQHLHPGMSRDESGMLGAFDSSCERIRGAAIRAYSRVPQGLLRTRPGRPVMTQRTRDKTWTFRILSLKGVDHPCPPAIIG